MIIRPSLYFLIKNRLLLKDVVTFENFYGESVHFIRPFPGVLPKNVIFKMCQQIKGLATTTTLLLHRRRNGHRQSRQIRLHHHQIRHDQS
jgi:hypothetical protein